MLPTQRKSSHQPVLVTSRDQGTGFPCEDQPVTWWKIEKPGTWRGGMDGLMGRFSWYFCSRRDKRCTPWGLHDVAKSSGVITPLCGVHEKFLIPWHPKKTGGPPRALLPCNSWSFKSFGFCKATYKLQYLKTKIYPIKKVYITSNGQTPPFSRSESLDLFSKSGILQRLLRPTLVYQQQVFQAPYIVQAW